MDEMQGACWRSGEASTGGRLQAFARLIDEKKGEIAVQKGFIIRSVVIRTVIELMDDECRRMVLLQLESMTKQTFWKTELDKPGKFGVRERGRTNFFFVFF